MGQDVSIRELAELIRDVVGFTGELRFDPSKPDVTPRKLLDVSRLHALGWRARIPLREGIAQTYAWYRERHAGQAGQGEWGAQGKPPMAARPPGSHPSLAYD